MQTFQGRRRNPRPVPTPSTPLAPLPISPPPQPGKYTDEAQAFRAWRLSESLTQVQLAALLGLTPRTIKRLESGKWSVPKRFLLACEAISKRRG